MPTKWTKAQTYFRGLLDDTADADMLELATSIIDKRTAPFSAGGVS